MVFYLFELILTENDLETESTDGSDLDYCDVPVDPRRLLQMFMFSMFKMNRVALPTGRQMCLRWMKRVPWWQSIKKDTN